jgi:hypothetical protein
MKISYTDKIAPLQPDGTVAMFNVRGVKEVRRADPSVDHGGDRSRAAEAEAESPHAPGHLIAGDR